MISILLSIWYLYFSVQIKKYEMAGATAPEALKAAINDGFLGSSNSIELKPGQPQPLGLFYDLDVFGKGLKDAQNAFGTGIIIANPIIIFTAGEWGTMYCD